jgi:hypothetical protein
MRRSLLRHHRSRTRGVTALAFVTLAFFGCVALKPGDVDSPEGTDASTIADGRASDGSTGDLDARAALTDGPPLAAEESGTRLPDADADDATQDSSQTPGDSGDVTTDVLESGPGAANACAVWFDPYDDSNPHGPISVVGEAGAPVVLSAPQVVIDFWGSLNPASTNYSGDDVKILSDVEAMLNAHGFWDRYGQYDVGMGMLLDVFYHAPGLTGSITDAQIRAQLEGEQLPVPADAGDPSASYLYLVFIGKDVSVTTPMVLPGSSRHDHGTNHNSSPAYDYPYAVVVEDAVTAGCDQSCVDANNSMAAARAVMGAATNPFGSGFSSVLPPGLTAASVAGNASLEIGDLCDGLPLRVDGVTWQQSWLQDQCRCDGAQTLGLFRPPLIAGYQDQWLLSNGDVGTTDIGPLDYGNSGDVPVVGDWDGDGTFTIGIFRPATAPGSQAQWYLSNSNISNNTDIGPFAFGDYGDVPVVGDWDGNGTTTVGVFRPAPDSSSQAQWLLSNSNTTNPTYIGPLSFGVAGDVPVVGDWDGNGTTTVGVFRPAPDSSSQAQWLLSNSNVASPTTDIGPLDFGIEGDVPVVGDWDGDGVATIGVFRNPPNTGYSGQWFLSNKNVSNRVDVGPIYYGNVLDTPVAGRWTPQ